MVSEVRPMASAAVHPPVEALLMSWKSSLVVGGAFQEEGFLLFWSMLGDSPPKRGVQGQKCL